MRKLLEFKLFKLCKNIYLKNKEIILYIFYGGLTTLVNFAVYIILHHGMGIYILTSNTIAFIVAVLFAYVTNKIFVFASHEWTIRVLKFEIITFFSGRLFSFAVDTAIIYVFADRIGLNDIIVKIGSGILVIIINYLFSKLIIFKKKTNQI